MAYALRLANGLDTASRVRMGDAFGLTPAGALAARAGIRPGGGDVTVAEGSMSVEVAPFLAWVNGTATDAQGGYLFVSDAAVTLALDAGDAAADRVDTIIARVRDDVYDTTGLSEASVEVVKGSPGGGAPVLPDSCVPLRNVTVPTGASAGTGGLSASDLGADRRVYASGLGGVVPVASAEERDTLGAGVWLVWRTDLGRLQARAGAGWDEVLTRTKAAQAGVLPITTGASGSRNIRAVVFATPFDSPPSVRATAETTFPDVHSVSVNNVTATGFDLYLVRNSGSATIPVHWEASPRTQ